LARSHDIKFLSANELNTRALAAAGYRYWRIRVHQHDARKVSTWFRS
jgi:hypothetical protein